MFVALFMIENCCILAKTNNLAALSKIKKDMMKVEEWLKTNLYTHSREYKEYIEFVKGLSSLAQYQKLMMLVNSGFYLNPEERMKLLKCNKNQVASFILLLKIRSKDGNNDDASVQDIKNGKFLDDLGKNPEMGNKHCVNILAPIYKHYYDHKIYETGTAYVKGFTYYLVDLVRNTKNKEQKGVFSQIFRNQNIWYNDNRTISIVPHFFTDRKYDPFYWRSFVDLYSKIKNGIDAAILVRLFNTKSSFLSKNILKRLITLNTLQSKAAFLVLLDDIKNYDISPKLLRNISKLNSSNIESIKSQISDKKYSAIVGLIEKNKKNENTSIKNVTDTQILEEKDFRGFMAKEFIRDYFYELDYTTEKLRDKFLEVTLHLNDESEYFNLLSQLQNLIRFQ